MLKKTAALGLVIVIIIMCFSLLTGCESEISGTPVQYDDIKALSDAVGFSVRGPSLLPEGYALSGYFSVKDKIAEILFVKGEEELLFAMTKIKNIKSDFGEFDEVKTVDLGGNSFEYSLIGGLVHLAVTAKDGMSYAVYSKEGLSEEEMNLIAENMFITDEEVLLDDMEAAQSAEPSASAKASVSPSPSESASPEASESPIASASAEASASPAPSESASPEASESPSPSASN